MPSLSCLRKLPIHVMFVTYRPKNAHTYNTQVLCNLRKPAKPFIVKVKARKVTLAFANQLLQNLLSYKTCKPLFTSPSENSCTGYSEFEYPIRAGEKRY